jgi:hypothetical protein
MINPASGGYLNFFIFDMVVQIFSCARLGICGACGRTNKKQRAKKNQKKACQSLACSARGNLDRQMPLFRRSKKVQKSEKKACQGLRNLISLSKPNQTNGETNDTKRTQNV